MTTLKTLAEGSVEAGGFDVLPVPSQEIAPQPQRVTEAIAPRRVGPVAVEPFRFAAVSDVALPADEPFASERERHGPRDSLRTDQRNAHEQGMVKAVVKILLLQPPLLVAQPVPRQIRSRILCGSCAARRHCLPIEAVAPGLEAACSGAAPVRVPQVRRGHRIEIPEGWTLPKRFALRAVSRSRRAKRPARKPTMLEQRPLNSRPP